MKKSAAVFLILFTATQFLFSQDAPSSSETETSGTAIPEKWKAPENSKEFWSQVSPFINLGLNITVNTESPLKSAPTPVSFTGGLGAIWPNNSFVSFQPRLSFYAMYYLWDGENALPAEIENRTASVLNFMLDLPAAWTFRFKHSQAELGAGLGFLARFSMLSSGVKASDSGASGTAQEDVDKISSWMWNDMHFLYPEIFAAWEYNVTERLKAGLEIRYYLPLGSLAGGRGLDASILSVATKIIF